MNVQFEIKESDSVSIVLDYLKKRLGLSSKNIIRLKQTPLGICVNGQPVTVRKSLCVGDFLTIAMEDAQSCDSIVPSALPLTILYEDDWILVVNKPYGMPTHPSHGHYSDTLANAVAYYYQEKGIPFVFRAVNRLDRDTSGIVLLAKNQISAYRLSLDMQNGDIHKTYLAVVSGAISPLQGEIKTYIRRKEDSIIFREVVLEKQDGADFAHTRYMCLACNTGCSVLKAMPLTGRTHQLRVHFAYFGHPICGDSFYGDEKALQCPIQRQALHAQTLEFLHPESRKPLSFSAPCPTDMQNLIHFYGL